MSGHGTSMPWRKLARFEEGQLWGAPFFTRAVASALIKVCNDAGRIPVGTAGNIMNVLTCRCRVERGEERSFEKHVQRLFSAGYLSLDDDGWVTIHGFIPDDHPPVTNHPASLVYFITAGGDAPIKIGCSTNVFGRLATLQTASPAPLGVVCTLPGDRTTEATLHRRFKDYRLKGEWFSPAPPILDYIREVQSSRPVGW